MTDSAGVRTTLSADAALVFGRLDPVPVLSLGGANAAGPTRFSGIQGMHVDPRGRLWVADGQSGELRIFQPDGAHWKTVGGRGEGPGEFARIRMLGAIPGDTVLIGDGALDRITVYDPEGTFVRTERLPGSDRPAPRPIGVLDDGSVLGQLPRIVSASVLEPGTVLPDTAELVRINRAGPSVEPFASVAGPEWLWTGRSQVPVPFTTNTSLDAMGDLLYVVSGPSFRIRVLGPEGLREIWGIEQPPRSVGPADVESYRAYVERYVPEPTRADWLSALDHERRPELLPGYDRVLAAGDGHVWAQMYETDPGAPHDWDVYDDRGLLVGRVHVLRGFYPMIVERDTVLGVWRDSLGVEHARVYRLVRS